MTVEHAPRISTHPSREELGRAAATAAAGEILKAIADGGRARIMLAAAPSQTATLTALAAEPGLDWSRVECFHMDEYVGLDPAAPQSFRNWLRRNFLDKVPQATFRPLDPEDGPDAYAKLMGDEPFDLVLFGLGVNGHLAFNDPPADFVTKRAYLVVQLDEACRRQQVGEGWFASLDDVPRQAISMSVSQILATREILAIVPESRKAQAVHDCFDGPVSVDHPASVLQNHAHTTIFLDAQSASLLERATS